MSDERQNEQPDLIGYHLGLLGPEEAAAVADQLVVSPELQQQRAALAEGLRPLDAMTVEPAGRELIEAVLARVARAPRVVPAGGTRRLVSGEDAPARGR